MLALLTALALAAAPAPDAPLDVRFSEGAVGKLPWGAKLERVQKAFPTATQDARPQAGVASLTVPNVVVHGQRGKALVLVLSPRGFGRGTVSLEAGKTPADAVRAFHQMRARLVRANGKPREDPSAGVAETEAVAKLRLGELVWDALWVQPATVTHLRLVRGAKGPELTVSHTSLSFEDLLWRSPRAAKL